MAKATPKKKAKYGEQIGIKVQAVKEYFDRKEKDEQFKQWLVNFAKEHHPKMLDEYEKREMDRKFTYLVRKFYLLCEK